jgi:transposase
MFIRKTLKIDQKTRKSYISYQLVEAYRTASGPRQKILLTIGSDIDLDPGARKDLANRIEDILKGTPSLFPCSDNIESLAQHFVKLIRQKQAQPTENMNQHREDHDFHSVDINNIRHNTVRTIGPSYIAFEAYKELKFDELFSDLRFTEKQKAIAAAAIIGRAVFPSSEHALHKWLQHTSGLDELLGTSFAKLSLDQLYFISDDLYQSKRKIEKHLREQEKTIFDLKEKIILYDITNTYFEGTTKGHSKAKRGKSKEMRYDAPLLSFGVVLDSDGFPKHSEIFPGNINERATLEEMIVRLNKKEIVHNPIIILDSGIATKDNIEWLKAQGYSYIVMMKHKDRPPKEACRDIVIRDKNNQFISATLKYDPKTDDHILWCYSQERLKKEHDIKQHKTNALESALIYLKDGLSCPRRIKTLEKVHQKIGRLREKYARLAQYYEIMVSPADNAKDAKDITWTYDEASVNKSFSGTYTLRTNLKDLSAESIWEIYVMLSEAESCYRCLKSEAGLRPNWHHLEHRIDGHMFLSLLSYHLIITIRKKLRDHGINDSWKTIREGLENHSIVATTLKTKEGSTIYLRQASEPNEYQKTIYRALGLGLKPIKTEKTIVVAEDVVSKN